MFSFGKQWSALGLVVWLEQAIRLSARLVRGVALLAPPARVRAAASHVLATPPKAVHAALRHDQEIVLIPEDQYFKNVGRLLGAHMQP